MRHDTTDTTRRDATGHDDPDAVVLTVADAAALLGISAGAVRKRIERGQLAGRKVSGQWQVVVGAGDETESDATSTTITTRPDATRRDATPPPPLLPVAVSDAARAQLAAIRDEFVAPLVDRIGSLERENGRLEAEREQVGLARAAQEEPGRRVVNGTEQGREPRSRAAQEAEPEPAQALQLGPVVEAGLEGGEPGASRLADQVGVAHGSEGGQRELVHAASLAFGSVARGKPGFPREPPAR